MLIQELGTHVHHPLALGRLFAWVLLLLNHPILLMQHKEELVLWAVAPWAVINPDHKARKVPLDLIKRHLPLHLTDRVVLLLLHQILLLLNSQSHIRHLVLCLLIPLFQVHFPPLHSHPIFVITIVPIPMYVTISLEIMPYCFFFFFYIVPSCLFIINLYSFWP